MSRSGVSGSYFPVEREILQGNCTMLWHQRGVAPCCRGQLGMETHGLPNFARNNVRRSVSRVLSAKGGAIIPLGPVLQPASRNQPE